ncbi:MAG: fibronectin type III domain-containing protein [Geobacteraceae bacterium]
MKKYLCLFVLMISFAACGKKGALVPPEALVPAAIADLQVAQQGESFLVSWSAPTREEGGRPLKGLAGFRLLRREVLPSGDDCEACEDAYRLIETVDLEYMRRVSRFGDRFFYYDAGLHRGTTYQYKVVAFRKDGTSGHDSNKLRRRLVSPPPPPEPVALSTSAGTIIEWSAVADKGGTVAGYNIYRWRGGEPIPSVPLNEQPIPETRFEDLRVEPGRVYFYVVRSVARVDGELAESNLSVPLAGTLVPPE